MDIDEDGQGAIWIVMELGNKGPLSVYIQHMQEKEKKAKEVAPLTMLDEGIILMIWRQMLQVRLATMHAQAAV